jgi:hypothetical protein
MFSLRQNNPEDVKRLKLSRDTQCFYLYSIFLKDWEHCGAIPAKWQKAWYKYPKFEVNSLTPEVKMR